MSQRPRVSSVENGIYYHVHESGHYDQDWSVGTSMTIDGNTYNPFYGFYDDIFMTIPIPGQDAPLLAHAALEKLLERASPDENVVLPVQVLRQAKQIIKEQALFVREALFEEVRKDHYPDCPSRTTCIFLCSEEGLAAWWEKKGGVNARIFKVSATGNVHRGAEKHLHADTYSHNAIRDHAHAYWQGCKATEDQLDETLFEGDLEVLHEYQNLDEFLRSTTRD